MSAAPFVEIYRSYFLPDCEQRAFLLYAVGIATEVVRHEQWFLLLVAENARDAAVHELQRHEAEARAAAPEPRAALVIHPGAWAGVFAYALTMIGLAWAAGEHLFGADWRAAGALRSFLAHGPEWQRLVTALTLHGDVAHLIANLAFGVFFGYFAGQLLGPGGAWLTILVSAVLGNLLDSLLMSPNSASIGASTAVFATLGLVAALSWRQRSDRRMRWAHRWAPLIAGVALLAFTGAGGENTDVVAHVTGFASGGAMGFLHAWKPFPMLRKASVQALAGAITVAVIAAAWGAALFWS